MRYILHISLLFLAHTIAGQAVCDSAPDFTDLNGTCVVWNYGNTSNPFLHTGIASTRHTRITENGFDPNTGNKLPLIPDGDSVSIRLGNMRIGAEAEALTYRFKVQYNKTLLALRFAVVLQDPGHAPKEQPRFVVRILNEIDQLVETCAEYDVTSSAGIPGFETYKGSGTPVRWRPWTTVALDLSSYVGQEIKVQFISYDCTLHGHFGYAYFTAECTSNKLTLDACKGDSIELKAPAFCESYAWTNGDTTASSTYRIENNKPVEASCLITSVTGCQFSLNAHVSNSSFTHDTILCDTVCEGEPYVKNNFNLPAQHKVGTSTHINSFYDLATCSGDVTAFLNLDVIQRYNHIEDAICHGEDYTKHGFNIQNPMPGTMLDTLVIPRKNFCDSIVYLTLKVSPSNQSFPKNMLGNTTPCSGEVETYSMPDAEFFSHFHWIIPEEVTVLGNRNAANISLQFTDESLADTLKLYAANGCGGDTLRLFVEPQLSYYLFFEDSICSGLPYTENGFELPRQDSSGVKLFTQQFQTANGCDSIRNLYLTVYPTPQITLNASKDVLCTDDSVVFNITSANNTMPVSALGVKIGDILCSDSSILDTADFKTSGKTAEGIVFWLAPDRTHGLAVSLISFDTIWGDVGFVYSVPVLYWYPISAPYTSWEKSDPASGSSYTNWVMNHGYNNSRKYPAIEVTVMLAGPWFLAAPKEARRLWGTLKRIEQSFVVAGAPQSALLSPLWTSVPHRTPLEDSAFYISTGGGIAISYRKNVYKVRPIKRFNIVQP